MTILHSNRRHQGSTLLCSSNLDEPQVQLFIEHKIDAQKFESPVCRRRWQIRSNGLDQDKTRGGKKNLLNGKDRKQNASIQNETGKEKQCVPSVVECIINEGLMREGMDADCSRLLKLNSLGNTEP